MPSELPFETFQRLTGGEVWPGGTDPKVVMLLRLFCSDATPGTEEANLALQKALLAVEALQHFAEMMQGARPRYQIAA